MFNLNHDTMMDEKMEYIKAIISETEKSLTQEQKKKMLEKEVSDMEREIKNLWPEADFAKGIVLNLKPKDEDEKEKMLELQLEYGKKYYDFQNM